MTDDRVGAKRRAGQPAGTPGIREHDQLAIGYRLFAQRASAATIGDGADHARSE
jgi:hypothetical protein